jgi:hypothetical protein
VQDRKVQRRCNFATKTAQQGHRLRVYDETMKLRKRLGFIRGIEPVCDFSFVNLLREKVRQQEAEEKRLQAFGPVPSRRFVAWIMPVQSPLKPDTLSSPDRLD